MEARRRSGLLAHPTSLPSPYGAGDFGPGAYAFVDFLAESKQTLWQVLPLNPTGYGDSPYQSFSAFALNGFMISPEKLRDMGLLTPTQAIPPEDIAALPQDAVDYGAVIPYKETLFRQAFKRFQSSANNALHAGFDNFCEKHQAWLEDYALFTAAKAHYIEERKNGGPEGGFEAYKRRAQKPANTPKTPETPEEEEEATLAEAQAEAELKDCYYGAVWSSWPEDLALRRQTALLAFSEALGEDIEYVKFIQYIADAQWRELKAYANKNGVSVIGDLPIFAAYDSADAWVNGRLFQMRGTEPYAVAGVPPDYFSAKGQLWGNPLYNWKNHKLDGFAWWISRMKRALELADVVRIDHFRGFEAYWSIPYGDRDAVNGEWNKAPGKALFTAIREALGDVAVIAEDLGVITPEVTALREAFGFPGMKVLQFAFEGGPDSLYMPHNFTDDLTVTYTGTHDNDTTQGWYEAAPEKARDYFRRYLNTDAAVPSWDMLRLAFLSSARWVVAPVQDVLGLGSEGRMNRPGVREGNWRWRFREDALTEGHASGLAYLSELSDRNVTEV